MPYAAIRDLHLYYELHGPADGQPIALFNGAFDVVGAYGVWRQQVEPLAAAGYRVLLYEHRGHGRTDNPPASFDSYAVLTDDALALFDHVGFARPHIAGFSDGAITAMTLAMTHPERLRGLILVGANYTNDAKTLKNLDNLQAQVIRVKFPKFAAQLDTIMPDTWEALAAQLRPLWLRQPDFSADQMAAITAPTLVMAGEKDPFGNTEQTLGIWRGIPKSELCILPAAGHPVIAERPDITIAIMLDFLTRRGNV